MSRLALHYGITDVGLAKTCRRMNIPRPGRGYWQQLAAHVKVKRAPLPKGSEHSQWTFLERVENVEKRMPKPPPPAPSDVPIPETLHGAHEAVQKLASLLSRADAGDYDRLAVGERVLEHDARPIGGSS
jgi:hypothetical protein